MSSRNKNKNRNTVKSNSFKLPRSLGYSETGKNINTLKKLEKSIEDEKEIGDSSLRNIKDDENWITDIIY